MQWPPTLVERCIRSRKEGDHGFNANRRRLQYRYCSSPRTPMAERSPLKGPQCGFESHRGYKRLSRAKRELARASEVMELVDRREYKRLSRAKRELARASEVMELVDRRRHRHVHGRTRSSSSCSSAVNGTRPGCCVIKATDGSTSKNVHTASWISSRASAWPRQKCAPYPN